MLHSTLSPSTQPIQVACHATIDADFDFNELKERLRRNPDTKRLIVSLKFSSRGYDYLLELKGLSIPELDIRIRAASLADVSKLNEVILRLLEENPRILSLDYNNANIERGFSEKVKIKLRKNEARKVSVEEKPSTENPGREVRADSVDGMTFAAHVRFNNLFEREHLRSCLRRNPDVTQLIGTIPESVTDFSFISEILIVGNQKNPMGIQALDIYYAGRSTIHIEKLNEKILQLLEYCITITEFTYNQNWSNYSFGARLNEFISRNKFLKTCGIRETPWMTESDVRYFAKFFAEEINLQVRLNRVGPLSYLNRAPQNRLLRVVYDILISPFVVLSLQQGAIENFMRTYQSSGNDFSQRVTEEYLGLKAERASQVALEQTTFAANESDLEAKSVRRQNLQHR